MDPMFVMIPVGVAALFVFIVFLGSFFTVNTAEVSVITRFGKFLRIADPGLNWKLPFFDSVAGVVSLRVNQISLTMETKTKDNVFVTIPISVQNRVRPEKAFDAFYKLSDPTAQIKSYVEQVILGHVPGMTLDEVFATQSSIAAAVKILVVKKAEAEAESKALQGQGIANQRKAIIEGLQNSIEQFQKVVDGTSSKEVMQLVLVTQYFDTLKSIGESDKTSTLFLPHTPGAVKEVSDQIMESMLVAGQVKG